jgi:hypothetical protein
VTIAVIPFFLIASFIYKFNLTFMYKHEMKGRKIFMNKLVQGVIFIVFLCQACKSAIIASKMALNEDEEHKYWVFAWGLMFVQLIVIIVYECI